MNGEARCGTILQTQTSGSLGFSFSNPLGQSFTVEDASIQSIGFSLFDVNESLGKFEISVALLDGVGFAGPEIGSVALQLPDGFIGFVDFDFSGLDLVVGDVVTAMVSSSSGRGGIAIHQHTSLAGDPIPGEVDYLGGDMIQPDGSVDPNFDLTFRVFPLGVFPPSEIVEPSTLVVFSSGILGIGLMAGWHRRGKDASIGSAGT
jgi:hypothetical protein